MGAYRYLLDRGLTAEAAGGKLYVSPAEKITDDDRAYIRKHKPAIIADLARFRRRNDVLMQLADSPGVKYAYTVDADSDPVILAVAIRDLATFEMTIPADRYDGFKLLTLLAEAEARDDA